MGAARHRAAGGDQRTAGAAGGAGGECGCREREGEREPGREEPQGELEGSRRSLEGPLVSGPRGRGGAVPNLGGNLEYFHWPPPWVHSAWISLRPHPDPPSWPRVIYLVYKRGPSRGSAVYDRYLTVEGAESLKCTSRFEFLFLFLFPLPLD